MESHTLNVFAQHLKKLLITSKAAGMPTIPELTSPLLANQIIKPSSWNQLAYSHISIPTSTFAFPLKAH